MLSPYSPHKAQAAASPSRSLRTSTTRTITGASPQSISSPCLSLCARRPLSQHRCLAHTRSGRWRSEYTIDTTAKTLEGKILVNVHYYEQGNVQLSTTHTVSLALPSAISQSGGASAASKVLALVEAEEGKFQTSLNDAYAEMSEKTFKGLRRALPMTRSKLDWDKVLGYKLGAELTNSKGVFGTA